jgi:hypothetical protein
MSRSHSTSPSSWTKRCSEILCRNAARFTNVEIAALIEAETGLRFSPWTVSRRRAERDLPAPRRNTWTAPVRRWSREGEGQAHRSSREDV